MRLQPSNSILTNAPGTPFLFVPRPTTYTECVTDSWLYVCDQVGHFFALVCGVEDIIMVPLVVCLAVL